VLIAHKLNAIADGVADLMRHIAAQDDGLHADIKELRAAVGLEDRESTASNGTKNRQIA
jgi:hypothetical protein